MGTILVTGIPSVGKTHTIRETLALCQRKHSAAVHTISLSEIVRETALHIWGTQPDRIQETSLHVQQALRYHAMKEASYRLGTVSPSDHVLIELPMTMYVRDGKIPDTIFNTDQLRALTQIRELDYVVTIIDDPHDVAHRLEHEKYPTDIDQILDWMVSEVNATSSAFPRGSTHTYSEAVYRKPRRLVLSKEDAQRNLAKLMTDPCAPVCYLAGPITKLKIKQSDSALERERKVRAKQRMAAFYQKLQEYCVVVSPMELADQGVTPAEIAHTVYRDIAWFVGYSDMTIAHFPDTYTSTGTMAEMHKTKEQGKPVILIHPKPENEVFSLRPDFVFRTFEDFFAALERSHTKEYGARKYAPLRRFVDARTRLPRYSL